MLVEICWIWLYDTVDGSEILHLLRLVVYPVIYGVLCIPGGWCFGFIPLTVLDDMSFSHLEPLLQVGPRGQPRN